MEQEHIEEIKEEINDAYSNDDLYNINSWGADLSFRELITMYEEDELLKPELQRFYVWEKPEASRFIESILLGLPVPSIFLANTKDDKKLIIDGYQRIMTVYDYVKKGIWRKDGKTFKLSNTDKINDRYRGKAFSELPEQDQRRIRSTTIHAIVFEQKAPNDNDTSLFQVFERINTGGRALMPQEIRNCVNQGTFNTLLFELNKNPNWRTLFGKNEVDPRMRDMEFILRFLALDTEFIQKNESSTISLKKYLNEFMGSASSQTPKIIEERREKFNFVMQFIINHIGENAFYNITGGDESKIRKRFYPTIFDSICPAIAIAHRHFGSDIPTENLEEKRLALLKDEDYKIYISEGTMQIAHIHGRIDKALNYLFGISYEQQ
ncbi:DUF262 domain-containing protein [Arenibacter palladensis]|uniref:DUF262 domain-containing protein n=1 Tax=Arenibacter palladensis TaxID=237373 RepID=UPI0026E23E5E|nr:DUF262 domain-containing protein [Arenibacter palladensis]MDO6601187.1 DUF262 domain-containing protein [Arenibacter palladensis]